MSSMIRGFLGSALALGLVATAASSGAAEPDARNVLSGRAAVYNSLDARSLEHVTSSAALSSELRLSNVAPTRIWKLLEHGEKVECLDCIPVVSRLLFDSNAKTREISAWWLRRRVFGVFGKGEVYSQIVATVSDTSQSEIRRSHAANALGEFLNPAGVPSVAKAAISDTSARVRLSAVAALERLNNEGPALELGQALSDASEDVRLSALHAAINVNVFSSVDKVVERFGDESPLVRRRAAEAVGAMRLADAVLGLVMLAGESTESSAEVRSAAVWALGQIAQPEGKPAVQAALSDSSSLVKDSARIALRRL
jgi:HEAT repeat protein